MYAAARGEGAFLNGEPLPAPVPREHSESGPGQLIIAIPSIRDEQAIGCVHTWIDRFVVRNLGTTALNLALVATGGFDAALATNAKLWDVAAGWILITEAGGVMTTPRGEPLFPLDPDPYGRDNTPALAALDRAVHSSLIIA
jgi:myo-inositol-1(or 4)-monophosphatase